MKAAEELPYFVGNHFAAFEANAAPGERCDKALTLRNLHSRHAPKI
jgi:hypothetical protein